MTVVYLAGQKLAFEEHGLTMHALGVAGRQVGEVIAQQLHEAIEKQRDINQEWLKTGIDLAYQHTPKAMALLEGIAAGAEVPLIKAFVVWYEELRDAKPKAEIKDTGCTDIAVRTDDGVLIAHTNDEDPGEQAALVPVEVAGLPTVIVAFTGGRPAAAVNSAGVVFSGNQVDSTDTRPGIPRVFLYTEALWSRSIDDAAQLLLHPQRASSYHNLLADEHGSVVGYEASAKKAVVLTPHDGVLIHTNHYLGLPEVEAREGAVLDRTVTRLHRAYAEVRKAGPIDADKLLEIMRTHGEGGLCRHDVSDTTFAMLFAPMERVFWYGQGSPCNAEFKKYSY